MIHEFIIMICNSLQLIPMVATDSTIIETMVDHFNPLWSIDRWNLYNYSVD